MCQGSPQPTKMPLWSWVWSLLRWGQGAREAPETNFSPGEGRSEGDTLLSQSRGLGSMKLEINRIDDIVDDEYERIFVPYDPARGLVNTENELPSPDSSNHVLVYRRVFKSNNKTIRKTVLDIKSYLILEVLKAVIVSQAAELEGHSSIPWPNNDVFRYREEIRRVATERGDLALQHVTVLMELIEQDYASRIRDINDLFPKDLATYEILREAFWPGDIVVDSLLARPRAYLVTGAWYEDHHNSFFDSHTRELCVNTTYMDCDGSSFGRVKKLFCIPSFEGAKYIKDHTVFPLKYHPEKDWAMGAMIQRGREFAALSGQHHKFHKGVAETYAERSEDPHPVTVDSRVMIDTKTFNRLETRHSISVSSLDELDHEDLSDEEFMLMTDVAPIFSFLDKTFFKASVDNIKDIQYNEDCFGQLVLDEHKKKLLRVVVDAHSKSTGFDDFVEGKGKGLVILLHGPPGVGKTMTAETVAEHTHRPLYTLTSGELGTSAHELETALRKALDIAKTFQAVLLLDEADVFLEKRTPHDVNRNALVSIFLRLLEYYRGVLFLTTNRIEEFDDAFHSRIHIALRFASLRFANKGETKGIVEKLWHLRSCRTRSDRR